ncbi:MAG: chromate transporter [Bacillota bacterium]|nr:chromate transporter [Bacillota bacterium]
MNVYLLLFYEFFKTGLFAVGGGLATLPFLYEIAAKYAWFTASRIPDMLAISESTPGPLGINMATFAGYNAAGIPGSVVATVALSAPSVIIIVLIARFLNKYKDNFYVDSVFYGLRPAVCAMISSAALEIFRITLVHTDKFGNLAQFFDFRAILFFAAILILMYKFKLHPIFYLAGAAALGIIFRF